MDSLPGDLASIVGEYLKHNVTWKEKVDKNRISFKLYFQSSDSYDKLRFMLWVGKEKKRDELLVDISNFINFKSTALVLSSTETIDEVKFYYKNRVLYILQSNLFSVFKKRCSSALAADIINWLKHVYKIISTHIIVPVSITIKSDNLLCKRHRQDYEDQGMD